MTDVDRAIEEVRTLAAELGLAADAPATIADKSNLVLGLGAGLVARVAMATSLVRVGMDWLRREVEVSAFLAARGAAVTLPRGGPFERGGFVISFWQRERVAAGPPDPRGAGAALRGIHRSLAAYGGDLPTWGAVEEARQILGRVRERRTIDAPGLRRLEAAWERADRIVEGARARSASFQPVHGDAHIGNVLSTARGPVWTDWEDTFIGPIEFDLACLRSKLELFGEDRDAIEAMTAAYGDELDWELVRDLGLVRNVQVIPWLAVFTERSAESLSRMKRRIETLPE